LQPLAGRETIWSASEWGHSDSNGAEPAKGDIYTKREKTGAETKLWGVRKGGYRTKVRGVLDRKVIFRSLKQPLRGTRRHNGTAVETLDGSKSGTESNSMHHPCGGGGGECRPENSKRVNKLMTSNGSQGESQKRCIKIEGEAGPER